MMMMKPKQAKWVARALRVLDTECPLQYQIDTEHAPSIYIELMSARDPNMVPARYHLRISDHAPNVTKFDPLFSIHPGSEDVETITRRVIRAAMRRHKHVRRMRAEQQIEDRPPC